jgi:phosphatidate cytidylyltransferase
MSSNLAKRIAFAVVAIPLAGAVLWLGGWWLAGTLAALGMLGAREVYDLARRQGIDALRGLGYGAAAAIPLATYAARRDPAAWAEGTLYAGALWLMALLIAAMVGRGPGRRPLAAVGVTFFGCVYASAPLAFLVAMRHGAAAPPAPVAAFALVLLPLALTWICDTAAFAAGTTFGGPKLAPVLSPRKTWSGAVGGTVAAVVAAVVLGRLVLNPLGWTFSLLQLLGVGLVVAVVGQVGDVAESLLKREAGVKDSSSLIPGHGGVLDRLDSLYFVIPASAALFRVYGAI